MVTLRLVQPVSIDAAIRRAPTRSDAYQFRQRFRQRTVDDLIAAFNSAVGSRAWTSARAAYLVALRDALLATRLDCAAFIAEEAMVMDRRVARQAGAIVPVQRS